MYKVCYPRLNRVTMETDFFPVASVKVKKQKNTVSILQDKGFLSIDEQYYIKPDSGYIEVCNMQDDLVVALVK